MGTLYSITLQRNQTPEDTQRKWKTGGGREREREGGSDRKREGEGERERMGKEVRGKGGRREE